MRETADRLASLLVGNDEAWAVCGTVPPDLVVAAAREHGVLPLIADRALRPDTRCPPALRERLHADARRHLVADWMRERELQKVVTALADAGISALLIKGADLAYSRYTRPDLRARVDTDLLIAAESRGRAAEVLEALDYTRVPQSGGDLLMYQEPFQARRNDATVHVVDLHWRVANPQVFGATFGFEELAAQAETRPRLAERARGLCVTHALLLACVHRVAHHFDSVRLVWSYDIHLLAREMSAGQWESFVAHARARGIQQVCVRGLETATNMLGTAVPPDVLDALKTDGLADRAQAVYMTPRTAHVRRVWSDLRRVGGWRERGRLARQHLFPPARYMRGVYAPSSGAPLWLLYVQRILRGSRRWLSRS